MQALLDYWLQMTCCFFELQHQACALDHADSHEVASLVYQLRISSYTHRAVCLIPSHHFCCSCSLLHAQDGEAVYFRRHGADARCTTVQACAWVIDELKATVPIWKKEYFSDGAVWKENAESQGLQPLGSS